MSAPGSDVKDLSLAAVSSKVNPTVEVKKVVEKIELIRTPISAPITLQGRPPYNPDAKIDHTAISNDENLPVGVCQVRGIKSKQQDAYGVFELKSGMFPQNYRLAKQLIFDVWEKAGSKFLNNKKYSGGCTAGGAISDEKYIYFFHTGDLRGYAIFRDPETNKILLVTRLQSSLHTPEEPKEMVRYKKNEFRVDSSGTKRLIGSNQHQMNVTRSVGDIVYRVNRHPELSVCNLTGVKDKCIVELLIVSDNVVESCKVMGKEELYIADILAKSEAKEINGLALQTEDLIKESLNDGQGNNQTAVMVRLIGKSKPLKMQSPLVLPVLKTSLTIATDGHSEGGEVIATEFIDQFPAELNEALTLSAEYYHAPGEAESKYEAKKERAYQKVRSEGQQYTLDQQVEQLQNPTFLKENLKKFFYDKYGYLFDWTSTKVLVDDCLGRYKKVKEITYCTLNIWEEQKQNENQNQDNDNNYKPVCTAQLEIDFIYDKSGKLISSQALFSLLPDKEDKKNLKNLQKIELPQIGNLSRIVNFNSAKETAAVEPDVMPSNPKPIWARCLNADQIAEIKTAVSNKLSETKSEMTKDQVIDNAWKKKPQIFWNYHSYLAYDEWLKDFFNAGNKLLHEQLIKYINNRFTMEPDNRLAWLYTMLETITSIQDDTACCWSSYANKREYHESLSKLVGLIESEIRFLIYFQPFLLTDDAFPVILKTQGDHADNYPSWLQYHRKSAIGCLAGSTGLAIGLPFIWEGIWAAATGTLTLFGGMGGQRAISHLVGKQMDARTQKLRENLNAVTQSPTNSGAQEFKVEGNTDKEDVIDQYVKAIADDADDALKQSILINNDILGQFAKMFEGKVTQQRIADFKTILMDDVFERFIIENPEVAKDFNKILISNNNKKDYKTLVKQVNPKIYDILFPEINLNQGPLPGTVPMP